MSTALVLLSDWQASQIEFWRPVKDWPAYEVSSFGRLRSYWVRSGGGNKYVIGQAYKIIPPKRARSKYHHPVNHYLMYQLSNEGLTLCLAAHKLVAQAFVSNPSGLDTVNHRNFFKPDCRAGNLEWTTRSDNSVHAIHNGVCPQNVLKLNADKVFEARTLYSKDRYLYNYHALGRRYGVAPATVRDAVLGRTWKHLTIKENVNAATL